MMWSVLDDFGDIQRWNPGVANSALTSSGPVGEGTTRQRDFKPFGAVSERIDRYVPNERLTVDIYETFKLTISDSVADFNIAPNGDGTELILHYSHTLNPSAVWQREPPTSRCARGLAVSSTVFNGGASEWRSMRTGSDRRQLFVITPRPSTRILPRWTC